MPGPKIPVVVTGNDMPDEGRRWKAYKTALLDLGISRTAGQRNNDRKELKAGCTLSLEGYLIKRSV